MLLKCLLNRIQMHIEGRRNWQRKMSEPLKIRIITPSDKKQENISAEDRRTIVTKIFLDDNRMPPTEEKRMVTVKSYKHCILLLDIFRDSLEFVDLDYDLGTKETGLDVLKYMNEKKIRPKHINIHSDHPTGAKKMRRYAELFFQDVVITSNKI